MSSAQTILAPAFFCTVVLACNCIPDATEPVGGAEWKSLPALPGPQQESAVFTLQKSICVLGGFDDARTELDLFRCYDPVTEVWSERAPFPVPAHHIQAAAYDDKVYALGFLTGAAFIADGRAFMYSPDENVWHPLASLPEGTARGGGMAVAADDGVFILGGRAASAVTHVHKYDPLGDSYNVMPDLPIPLDHLSAGLIDDDIYIAGGRQLQIRAHTPRAFRLSDGANAWTEVAPMPTSRAGMSASVVGGKFICAGGEGADTPSGVFDQVEVYDPMADTWTTITPMRDPRHGGGASTIGSTMFVPGGGDVQGFAAVATFDGLTLSP